MRVQNVLYLFQMFLKTILADYYNKNTSVAMKINRTHIERKFDYYPPWQALYKLLYTIYYNTKNTKL